MVSFVVFFFKQKTAYEMRISDWSSDVCSSDLGVEAVRGRDVDRRLRPAFGRRAFKLEDEGEHGGDRDEQFLGDHPAGARGEINEIGRASCRERVCQYV